MVFLVALLEPPDLMHVCSISCSGTTVHSLTMISRLHLFQRKRSRGKEEEREKVGEEEKLEKKKEQEEQEAVRKLAFVVTSLHNLGAATPHENYPVVPI